MAASKRYLHTDTQDAELQAAKVQYAKDAASGLRIKLVDQFTPQTLDELTSVWVKWADRFDGPEFDYIVLPDKAKS